MKQDEHFMQRALSLAEKGAGQTSPNPLVGAVVVKKGQIVGEGYHKKAGLPHAEIEALRKAGKRAKGARMYVNLEPCCHRGKTPPCTKAILASGIRQVVIGMRDPNPLVQGKGVRWLKKNGIEVIPGVLQKDCERINEIFCKFIMTHTPFVILKAAMSLDGKIATRLGQSKWITGMPARKQAHELRRRVDAIIVGAGTVIKDNPRLTTRLKGRKTRHPVRVILDSSSTVPLTSKVFHNGRTQKVIYVATNQLTPARGKKLRLLDIEVCVLKEKNGRIDLRKLVHLLGAKGITSVLIEGGGQVHASALKEKIVDKVIFFFAPTLIGGLQAPSAIGGEGVGSLKDAFKIKHLTVSPVGKDLMVEGYL
ncbi:MAG: bifunctional diaminohydroxyphosphoribosylaminopyrimidine deaminase/5-amino-6-(5-phosphoribosylamino)uracil reductase RibD [Nitrospinota bacterium]|nr:bifunctional diaminohydroxyphosphoribosylaminopyrimidine deaminase/5-amino-6-(5-phosphoribosylamino)uracil reductase RibD [Nitrospinota bacterium]